MEAESQQVVQEARETPAPAPSGKQAANPAPANPSQDKAPAKPEHEEPKEEPAKQAHPEKAPVGDKLKDDASKPGEQVAESKPDEKPQEEKPKQTAHGAKLLLFNRWDTSQVEVRDAGLRNYMNLVSMPVPKTGGKYGSRGFQKNRMPIVERFMNKLWVSGHRGKKHKLTSGPNVGKTPMLYRSMKQAFEIIEKKTKQNPVQVLVGAIENSAVLEEVASYRLGGIIARNSVISSPQRRLDLALRHLTQGIHRSSFRNKQSLAGVIANDLIAAYSNDSKSFAVSEKKRMEKEAEGAR